MYGLKFSIGCLAAAWAVAGLAPQASAAPLNEPVPAANFITVDGVDWAWAAPCAPLSPSCGVVDMSYQSGQGWALPTVGEMDMAIAAAGGSAAWADLFMIAGNLVCASAWFSTAHSHCDYSNAVDGYIYNWSGGQAPNPAEETFVLRGDVITPTIPVPAALPLLASGLALVFGFSRRRSDQG